MSERELLASGEMDSLIDGLSVTETLEFASDDELSLSIFSATSSGELNGSWEAILHDKKSPELPSISDDSTSSSGSADNNWLNCLKTLSLALPSTRTCIHCHGWNPIPFLLPKMDDLWEEFFRVIFSPIVARSVRPCEAPACSCSHQSKNSTKIGMKYNTSKEKGAAKAKPVERKDKTDSSSSSGKTVKGTIRLFFTSIIDFCVSHEQC